MKPPILNLEKFEEIKIEKGVPIPESPNTPRKALGLTETLKKMEVGDSILLSRTRASACRSVADRIGIVITSRQVDKETSRIWRIQ